MATVTVDHVAYTAAPGTRLGSLLAAHQLMEMPCGGNAHCGKCRVTAAGRFSPPSDAERRLLTPVEIAGGLRLACCAVIEGDCVVTLAKKGAMQISTAGDMPLTQLQPAFSAYGAAVDIGTTTLAARLYDTKGGLLAEASRLNPQAVWGADVISRIDAALKGAHQSISSVTCRAVDELMTELSSKAQVDSRKIDALVITGNTAMLHLLTDTSTEPLSHAPFAVQRLFGERLTAGELGISSLSPHTEIYLPPCAAAFIGADTVTALLAANICSSQQTRMLVDIGTNGEMALWHKHQLTFCSTAAGPAFEGAGISMGMGGKTGAIDHVSLQNGALTAHVIGDANPVGICGSGVLDAIACLLENEELDPTGFLQTDPALIQAPVSITQKDVRMVQLAKSAIHAGILTLLHAAGLSCEDLSELLIAGGFGSYLDISNACGIGLFPSELLSRIRSIGNAALSGAAMLLLNRNLRSDCAQYAQNAAIVDLSTNPVFAEEYMEKMLF